MTSVELSQSDQATALGVDKINTILESFMGINDNELGKYYFYE